MAFLTAYSAAQYLQRSLCATTAGSLAVGTAVKLTMNRKTPTDLYYKVDAAGSADTVFGVVYTTDASLPPLTDTSPGTILPLNAAMVLVRCDNNYVAGDKLKVKTTDGKWGKIAAGETPLVELVEEGKTNDLAWGIVL